MQDAVLAVNMDRNLDDAEIPLAPMARRDETGTVDDTAPLEPAAHSLAVGGQAEGRCLPSSGTGEADATINDCE